MDQDDLGGPSRFGREEDDEYVPWYKDPSAALPFQIIRKISLNNDKKVLFETLAIFPWDAFSLKKLWPEGKLQLRNNIILECSDAVAVGAGLALYIFFARQKQPPICVSLPADNQQLIRADKTCVAWALVTGHNGQKEPLIIVSRGSLIYIYNFMQKGISAWIRGHGGAITSISVHPTTPYIFCTTSRDFTTRIYDLRLSATYTPDLDAKGVPVVPNPHWPPGKQPSLAGAAHGLRLPPTEREGVGHGRCTIVLMGNRSGGHEAAVLASAFHPSLPLIATAGMDRTVKIWAIRPTGNNLIKREDKPLFSSSRIHKSRVLSISWLREDLLLTSSAPAFMRRFPEDKKDKTTVLTPGELSIWKWLGLNRFFPPEHRDDPRILQGLRGISSDYQESSSFKIISTHWFSVVPTQYNTPNLRLFQPDYHDPIISFVYPGDDVACLLNAAHMSPRPIPPFPAAAEKLLRDPATEGEPLARATQELHISNRDADREDGNRNRNRNGEEDDGDDDDGDEPGDEPHPSLSQRPEMAYPPIPVRLLNIDGGANSVARLIDCEMGMGGRMIVGIGSEGCLWVWTLVQRQP